MAESHEHDLVRPVICPGVRNGHPVMASLLTIILVIVLTWAARSLIGDRYRSQGEHAWGLFAVAGVMTLAVMPLLRRRSVSGLDAMPAASVPTLAPNHVGRVARRHRRFVPSRRSTTLYTQNGRQIVAQIVDVSIAGVAVQAGMSDLEFATAAKVGSRAVAPIRRTDAGAVFRFAALLDPLEVHRDMAL